jgi:hypothetical protein
MNVLKFQLFYKQINLKYYVYSTHNGNGTTTAYAPNGFTLYPLNAAQFDILTNVALSPATTLAGTGSISASIGLDFINYTTLTAAGVPVPNSGDYYAFAVYGSFTPTTTGTYTFTCESDDSADLFINNTFVCGFYGGRGTPPLGTTTGSISLTAGTVYNFRARMQEYAGGDGLRVFWIKPGGTPGVWIQDTTELSNNSGPFGPYGPQSGVSGPAGLAGPTGGQGAQGAQGPQGYQGAQGPQGDQGFQGSRGNQGGQGNTGDQGGQGPTGLTGDTGPQGAQGPTSGVQGPQGGQGGQGGQGASGSPGLTGPSPTGGPGAQGFQGPTSGVQGPQGPQGITGDTGSTGNTGFTGPSPTGGPGAQGFQGPQSGTQGPQGGQGSQGGTGARRCRLALARTAAQREPHTLPGAHSQLQGVGHACRSGAVSRRHRRQNERHRARWADARSNPRQGNTGCSRPGSVKRRRSPSLEDLLCLILSPTRARTL